jgi:hypothetical protein
LEKLATFSSKYEAPGMKWWGLWGTFDESKDGAPTEWIALFWGRSPTRGADSHLPGGQDSGWAALTTVARHRAVKVYRAGLYR